MQGELHIQVREHTQAPAVGSQAIASRTPTIASTHGNLKELTTRTPPDTELLRYSVADSLAAHVPFVLLFATPKYCATRTCGPVVDVAQAVKEIKAGKVEFRVDKTGVIHVPVGKISFASDKLLENATMLLQAVVKAKPAAAKGKYVRSVTICSTMGPGIALDTTPYNQKAV